MCSENKNAKNKYEQPKQERAVKNIEVKIRMHKKT